MAPKPDSPVDGGDGAAATVQDGKLILVHAAMYAPSLRFCFGSVGGDGGTITVPKQAFPLPATAQGVPPGSGGPSTDQGDFSDRTIELYAIDASKLTAQLPDAGAAELNCSQLLGTDGNSPNPAGDAGLGLVKGTDYWDLGQLPKGTLAPSTTTLAVVTGCGPGAPNPDYNCPLGQATTLGLSYKTLDRTTPLDGGSIGAQFAFESVPFRSDSLLAVGSSAALAGFYITTLVPAPVPDAGDGGDAAADAGSDAAPQLVPQTTVVPVAVPTVYGDLKPSTLVPVSGVTFDGTSGFLVTALGDGGAPTPFSVPMPLPTIHDLSWGPGSNAAPFQNGSGYVFILVGDPQLKSFIGADGGPAAPDAGGSFNPFSAHILGFPTNPPLPK